MSIFSSIRDSIFGKKDEPAADETVAAVAEAAAPAADAAVTQPALEPVDVEAVLADLLEKSGQHLNWRTSIVDLLKLLGMDSSLAERRKLAAELSFDGDTDDTATMNVWLHKAVMQKLAENGGKVPADLLS